MASRVLAEHQRLDLLVNNAGIGEVGNVLTTKEEESIVFRVNVKGILF